VGCHCLKRHVTTSSINRDQGEKMHWRLWFGWSWSLFNLHTFRTGLQKTPSTIAQAHGQWPNMLIIPLSDSRCVWRRSTWNACFNHVGLIHMRLLSPCSSLLAETLDCSLVSWFCLSVCTLPLTRACFNFSFPISYSKWHVKVSIIDIISIHSSNSSLPTKPGSLQP